MGGDGRHFLEPTWVIFGLCAFFIMMAAVYCTWQRLRGPSRWQLTNHFLAERSLGPVTLGLSLCASMFSGYTVLGLPAEAYSKGYTAWRWVGSCTFLSAVYMAYAPRLHWLTCARGYDSVLSYVKDRYGITSQVRDPMHWLMVAVLLASCFIYLVAQLDAFGSLINTLTDGRMSRLHGALSLAGWLALCEIAGGFQVVEGTNAVQGAVLIVGSLLIFLYMDTTYGGLPGITSELQTISPNHVAVMDNNEDLLWAEFMIGVGVQRALFPDCFQRTMAATSQNTLRMANAILLLAPFLIQVPLLFIGIIGRIRHPGLEEPTEVFSLVILDIVNYDGFGRCTAGIAMAAALAAIMATADSALFAASQILTLDVVRPFLGARDPVAVEGTSVDGVNREASCKGDKDLVVVSRIVAIVFAAVCLQGVIFDLDLRQLRAAQAAMLTQALPTLVLALYWPGLHKWAAFAGLVVGVAAGIALVICDIPGGVLLALLGNLVVTITVACALPKFALPVSPSHAEALCHIYWRIPPQTLASGPPPCRKEPVNSWWGLGILAVVLPWFALPLYRNNAGGIDPYLSGSPVWAICAVAVLGIVHALLIYIISFHWQGGKRAAQPGAADSGTGPAVASPPSGESQARISELRDEVRTLRAEVVKLTEGQAANLRLVMREEVGALFA